MRKESLAFVQVRRSAMVRIHLEVDGGDPGGRQAFAFCYGYIKAVLQALAAFG